MERKQLPDLLENPSTVKDKKKRSRIAILINQGILLKVSIKERETMLDEVKEELMTLQTDAQLEGVRVGAYGFSATFNPGNETLKKDKLKEYLVAEDVDVEIIDRCFKKATEMGKSYWKKELWELKS